jgi:hypothetical protein
MNARLRAAAVHRFDRDTSMFSLLRRPPPLVHLRPRLFAQRQFLGRNTSDASSYTPRREPWVTPTMLLIGFVPIFTFALGTWQLQRLQWKVALIDELEEKLQLQPLSFPKRIKCGHPSMHLFIGSEAMLPPQVFQ